MYAFIAHSHTILDDFYFSMDTERERELTGGDGGGQGGRGFRYVTVTTVFVSLPGYSDFFLFYKSNCLYYTVLIIRDSIKN